MRSHQQWHPHICVFSDPHPYYIVSTLLSHYDRSCQWIWYLLVLLHHYTPCCVCFVHSVGKTGGQMARGSQSVTVQPWLVGLTAVVVFLLIVFIILIANRLFRKKRSASHTHTHTHRWKRQHLTCLLVVVLCYRSDEDGWDYEKAIELDGAYNKQTTL